MAWEVDQVRGLAEILSDLLSYIGGEPEDLAAVGRELVEIARQGGANES